MSYRPNLDHLSSAYRQAETSEARVRLPDGIYQGEILNAQVRQSVQTGSLSVSWELGVILDNGAIAKVYKSSYLSEKAFPMFKGDLKAIGIDPNLLDPFSRLYEVLPYLIGATIEFEQRTTPDKNDPARTYSNQNFQRLIKPSGKPFPSFDGFPMTDEEFSLPWEQQPAK